jgi:hypothetical protein
LIGNSRLRSLPKTSRGLEVEDFSGPGVQEMGDGVEAVDTASGPIPVARYLDKLPY